jgi:hypothetical protein
MPDEVGDVDPVERLQGSNMGYEVTRFLAISSPPDRVRLMKLNMDFYKVERIEAGGDGPSFRVSEILGNFDVVLDPSGRHEHLCSCKWMSRTSNPPRTLGAFCDHVLRCLLEPSWGMELFLLLTDKEAG